MDTEGLTMICAGLGLAIEDDDGSVIGYTKTEYCLDNLKDMQRYLRRDDPLKRNVFKQLCKWNTVSRDLIPLMEFHQTERNLVITIVKVLVFLTMPVDPTSDDVSQQIECLWGLKAALTRNTTIAVIVSLLEDPLEHLERDVFSEEDWKLVQLVLTLFRNLLAVQEVLAQQRACGSASQLLAVRDKFLEILFMENFMDLVLVLTQHVDDRCGYLRQDNLLLLEIFYYVFLGQDPALIVQVCKGNSKNDGDISTALDSLISIIEDEAEQRRNIRQRDLGRHSEFSGTFSRLTVDGSKTLFKRNPASACGEGLLKAHKVQRGPLKRTAWDKGFLSFHKDSILELLHNFLVQLLSGGYNVLMQSIHEDIEKEHHAIQHSDVILFFQVAHFVTAFQYKASITKKQKADNASESSQEQGHADDLFHGNICGPIAATMNEGMFYLVISKWREAFESLKETQDYMTLSAAGSLMKYMIRMLDLVLKLLSDESNEPQLARILLYKIFYDQTDQGFTHFLLNLFKSFDIHKQPKSDLADLLEMIYVTLRLMEKLQARGTLKVFRKSRGRKKKNLKYKSEEAEKLREQDGAQVSDGTAHNHERCISNSCTDVNKFRKEQLADSNCVHEEGIPASEATKGPCWDSEKSMDHDSSHKHINRLDEGIVGEVCEKEEFSNDEHQITTNEVDFNVTKMFTNFTNSAVIRNLCWLLKYYKSNTASTNHYIICMLKKICDDLDLAPMLYQLSVLTTFYGILAEKKASKLKHYADIMDFLTKFVRKMLRTLKNQPLLFIDILFWKTRKECHCINADVMIDDIGNLKKDFRCWEGEGGPQMGRGPQGWRSIADSLGDDEADFGMTNDHNKPMEGSLVDQTLDNMHKSKPSVLNNNEDEFVMNIDQTQENRSLGNENQKEGSEKKKFCDQVQESTIEDLNQSHARKRIRAFTAKQESEIRALYEQFKDQKRCSYMIAKAFDDGNTYTAAQISRKLRQLGIASEKKRFSKAIKPLEDDGLTETEKVASEEALQLRERKKRNRLQNTNIAKTGTSEDDSNQTLSTLHKRKRNEFPRLVHANRVTSDPDSENETLSNLFKKVASPRGSPYVIYSHNKHGSPLYTDNNPTTELESNSSRNNNVGRTFTFHDELLEDFTASEDEINPEESKVARRSLKMVIDAEDDEDF